MRRWSPSSRTNSLAHLCARPCVARLAVLFLLMVLSPQAGAETLEGRVVGVTDGDTLTLLVGRKSVKVRLAEVDTPERGQPWGNNAKQALSGLVFARDVRVETEEIDRFGRAIGHVHLGEVDVNRALVRGGHAWVYRKYSKDTSLIAVEAEARAAGEGLWSLGEAPVPPWEWRRGKRATAPREARAKAFSCGSKRLCGEMESCEEATFYLEMCGQTRLDGDGDGVPCERLCR